MEINKVKNELIHDKDAMWDLACRFIVKFELLIERINNIKEDEFIIIRGCHYDNKTKEYKKELLKLETELAVLKDVFEIAKQTHKYLI